jgi:PHD/YefM family antitoxin component YafN of YafNO toxin-antitoxin module
MLDCSTWNSLLIDWSVAPVINLKNIYSLSDFQRKTREHLRRLKRTRRPEVLTINGKAELVIQDAESYQELLDALDQAEALAGIRVGLDSAARGEGRPATRALAAIRKKHRIARDV